MQILPPHSPHTRSSLPYLAKFFIAFAKEGHQIRGGYVALLVAIVDRFLHDYAYEGVMRNHAFAQMPS